METPTDEPNLPSAVAIHQCKVAQAVVFSLPSTPLPRPPAPILPHVWLKLALESHLYNISLGSSKILILLLLFIFK